MNVEAVNAANRKQKEMIEHYKNDPVSFIQTFIRPDFVPNEAQRFILNQMMDNADKRVLPPYVSVRRGRISDEELLRIASAPMTAYPCSDGDPINIIRHPQKTPLWKRILFFWKRPRLTESNLEESTLQELKTPEPNVFYSYYRPHHGKGEYNGGWERVKNFTSIPEKLRESDNYRTHHE